MQPPPAGGEAPAWSVDRLAKVGGRDPQLLPVLGHRTAGEGQPVAPQQLRDARVREGTGGVLSVDHLLDLVLDAYGADGLAHRGRDAAVEEEAQLVDAARGVHV